MKRLHIALSCFGLMFAGCDIEDGVVVQLVDVPAIDVDCVVNGATTEFVATDVFDPRGGSTHFLAVRIISRLADQQADPVTISGGSQNLRPLANDLLVRGFEACWYRVEDPTIEFTDLQDPRRSPFVDCGDLPASQSAFLLSSGTIPAGADSAATSVELLTTEHLQGLYGALFRPTLIPQLEATGVRFAALDPTSPNWGEYPASREPDTIIMQVRLVAERQAGQTVRSNWLTHPVDIAVGAAQGFCGDAVVAPCEDPCGGVATMSTCDIGAGTDPARLGTCVGGTLAGAPCRVSAFQGSRPAVGGCFPYQGQGGFACESFSECL